MATSDSIISAAPTYPRADSRSPAKKKATTAENSGSSVKISPMWMAEVYFCCTAVTVKAMPVQKTDRNRALLQPVAVWGRQGVSNKTDSSSITVPVTNC